MEEDLKPIIVSDVDVSKCEFLTKTGHCKAHMSIMGIDTNKCECFPNCYYKQLKRKEQSEERLVKQIQTICDFINNRPEIFKGIYGDVDKIITEYAERKEQECEELKEDRERWKSNFNGKVSAIEELLQQLDQLKTKNIKIYKTLTEIKEIAEKQAPYLNVDPSKTMIEIEYDYAGAICNLEQRMYKILQKISEVVE